MFNWKCFLQTSIEGNQTQEKRDFNKYAIQANRKLVAIRQLRVSE